LTAPTDPTSAELQLRVPDLGDAQDVAVIDVLVKPGDHVSPDTPLVTLESDKATMDVPAVAAGTIASVLVKAGDKVSTGSIIATLVAAAAATRAATVGDEIVALPSGATTRIARIDVLGEDREAASAPLSVTLHLEDDIDVSRGDVIALAAAPPQVATRLRATVAWLDEQPLTVPARLEARQGARTVPVIVEELQERLELDTMEHVPAETLEANDLGIITLLSAQPLVLEPYRENRAMGSMVLIDPATNRTVAAVMVDQVLVDA
jgi:pyruvate/2-oxoglutarate dehydrogenase complex dihydrolipoamide acyltransferase (E2) component